MKFFTDADAAFMPVDFLIEIMGIAGRRLPAHRVCWWIWHKIGEIAGCLVPGRA
jgi:hypothetical protein